MLSHRYNGIHGFWFKRFTFIHDRLALQLCKCLEEANIPEWMTKRKTTPIQKDPLPQRNHPSNYRLIACLLMKWKMVLIREEIYCTIAMIWLCVKRTSNLEIRKTRNDFFVQVRNFLLALSLKVLRHKEKEAQSFYSGFFICSPHSTRVAPTTKVSASKRKPTVFPRGRSYLNS